MKSRLLSRLVLLIAVAIAVAAVVSVGPRFSYLPNTQPPAHAPLPARLASYLGVYETGSPPDYQAVTDFAQTAGKHPNLVGYYSGWAQPFESSFAQQVRAHGATPFVQIDPTLASVSAIAAGSYDIYLRTYADSVRDFGHAVVIGFGHEMNTSKYSWGYGHVRASTFVAAWRHIVTLFHGQGADNVTWLWTVNQDTPGSGPLTSWWPGASYVTWIGIDGYYYRPSDTFAAVFGRTINQVRAFTRKPVLLSETAVGPGTDQFALISNLFAGMRKYKTLGLVWFDIAQRGSIFHQDWRLEGKPAAVAAFKLGLSTLTLAQPSR